MTTGADPPAAARRVVVTGGSTGIGRATVDCLLDGGARVAVLDVNAEEGERLAAARAPDVAFWPCDVSDEQAVDRALDAACEWLGGVDALVHAAGIMAGQAVPLVDLSHHDFDRVVAVNLRGTFSVCQAVARRMAEGGAGGVVVLVGSGAGVVSPSGSVAYAASKGGLHGMAMTIAPQLEPLGIRVNEVCPALVDTPLVRDSIRRGLAAGGSPDLYQGIEQHLVPPGTVAEVIAFLTSRAADGVKGTVFTR